MTPTYILMPFAGMSASEASIRLQALAAEEANILIDADLVTETGPRRVWTQQGIQVLRAMRRSR